MKKRILVLILLSLVTFSFGEGYKSEMTRYFDLQAGYESAWSLSVEPIPAQSLSYIAGMPFSIEDPMVLGASSTGREIASWSVLSNVDFRIHIYGRNGNGQMYPVIIGEDAGVIQNPAYQGDGLDYILTFTYRLGYVTNGVEQTVDGEFEYKTSENSGESYFTMIDAHESGEGANAFIGSVDGSIFFRFDEASADRIENQGDTLPSGDYMAYLTIELESRQ